MNTYSLHHILTISLSIIDYSQYLLYQYLIFKATSLRTPRINALDNEN